MENIGCYGQRGTLKSGKDFYISLKGLCTVEQDHCYLVDATPEEMDEIAEILLTARMATANLVETQTNPG